MTFLIIPQPIKKNKNPEVEHILTINLRVTESVWQVDGVEKVHIYVDPQGEKIEAMGRLSGRTPSNL